MKKLILIALALVIFSLVVIAPVSADSDYCTPIIGTITEIDSDGPWSNITITGDCPICVDTVYGLDCIPCPFITRSVRAEDDEDDGEIFRGRSFPFARDIASVLVILFR